jgi:hypothetical protein
MLYPFFTPSTKEKIQMTLPFQLQTKRLTVAHRKKPISIHKNFAKHFFRFFYFNVHSFTLAWSSTCIAETMSEVYFFNGSYLPLCHALGVSSR